MFDGHPEIITLPGVYLQGWFSDEAWRYFKPNYNHSNWRQTIINKILEHYEPLFDARSKKNVFAEPFGNTDWLAEASGFTNMGESRDQFLKLDKTQFGKHMICLLQDYPVVNRKQLFQLIHLSFSMLTSPKTKERSPKKQLLYHIHNPNIDEFQKFSANYPAAKYLFAVRHPIQGLNLMLINVQKLKTFFDEYGNIKFRGMTEKNQIEFNKTWAAINEPIHLMFNILMYSHIDAQATRGIRLEDIKQKPEEILPMLTDWLGISAFR